MKTQGKLIVIDGTDGSGKTEQTTRLIARLRSEGHRVELTDFPQYGKPSAYFVEEYLRKGTYGTPEEVGAYRASVFYALDRYDASFQMRKWLNEGVIIVSNRYVSANMGHQAGKIADSAEREKFLTWLKDFEFSIMGIPKPDVNILLYMPPERGQALAASATASARKGTVPDAHEADIDHLRQASTAFLEVANKESWKVIDNCIDATTLKSLNDVHEEIYAYLKSCGMV